MRLKKYVLMLFVVVLITQLIRIYNFGVNFASESEVSFKVSVVEENGKCLFSKQIWSFELENCDKYQTGSVLKVFGRLVGDADSQFSNKKRLIVESFGVNNISPHSVIAWTTVVNKSFVYHRDKLIHSVMGYLYGPGYTLMTDMVFGQVLKLSDDSQHQLKTTGMLHVVAASGFNISLITILANVFSRHFGRFKAFLIWLSFVGAYFLLTDLSISIVRAFLMMTLKKSGALFGFRNYHNLFSLATASFVILLFDPMMMFSVSLQLSVLATLGIVLFMPLFGIDNPALEDSALSSLWPIIKESFQTTLAAQLFTIPIILYHFSEISLLSFVTNTALLWLTPMITLGGVAFYFLALLSSFISITPLLQILSFYLWLPTSFFMKSIEFFAKADSLFITNIDFGLMQFVVYLAIILIIYYYLLKKHEKNKKKLNSSYLLKSTPGVISHP